MQIATRPRASLFRIPARHAAMHLSPSAGGWDHVIASSATCVPGEDMHDSDCAGMHGPGIRAVTLPASQAPMNARPDSTPAPASDV
jgi:hypothetical protein